MTRSQQPKWTQPWPPFQHSSGSYCLSHLDSFVLQVQTAAGATRNIRVAFDDHCFTRSYLTGDPDDLIYPNNSRIPPGSFCFDRYHYSKGLRNLIQNHTTKKCWVLRSKSFAIIADVLFNGQKVFYDVIFTMERIKYFSEDMLLQVRSAYHHDLSKPDAINTFGNVKFAHLVDTVMQNKTIKEINDPRRQRPKLESKTAPCGAVSVR